MVFDRLLYIDTLKEAGVNEPLARAHAEALREALVASVATKADLKDGFDAVERKFEAVDRKIEITARDLTIKGAGGLIVIATLIVGLKLFG